MAKNDDTIKALMAKVATQKDALGYKPSVSWKTNAIFKYEDGKNYINLNTVKEASVLVELLSIIIMTSMAKEQASKLLSIPVPKFEWGGYSVDDWVTDFKTRLSIINWEAKHAILAVTQNKLSKLVSEEARTEMELDDIAKSLE